MDTRLSPDQAASASHQDILSHYAVDPDQGLRPKEVKRRRQDYGLNKLQEKQRRGPWAILIDQFKSPIIALLAAAALLAFTFQDWIEGIAVIVAILLNAVIGFTTEIRAVQSMKALKRLSQTQAKVRRDGQVQEIPAEQLVPGDIVLLEAGDLVAADLRLIEVSKLQADESALTGESVPVTKSTNPVEPDRPLAEQVNRVFKGTAITRGSGAGVVTATGMDTELGHISALAESAGDEQTPLEKRLDQLGRRLIWVTLAIATMIAALGIIQGRDLFLMIETAIALAVAAVPEGLPIVATVALARGMWRMAQRHALINRLSAVETLGATSIICTDKTGTLTENQMTVTQIALADHMLHVQEGRRDAAFLNAESGEAMTDSEGLRRLLEVGLLCSNAELSSDESPNGQLKNASDHGDRAAIGDPMEVALLLAGRQADLERAELLGRQPEAKEVAFDSDVKMMATFHHANDAVDGAGEYRVAVKGAPEAVLSVCSNQFKNGETTPLTDKVRSTWRDRAIQMAESGLRILAMAEKTVESLEAEPYAELTLLGIVGLEDPPRQDVQKAIAECYDAGIRIVMVTGDQPITARKIGQAVGLVGDRDAQALQGKALRSLDDLTREERQRLEQVPIFARVSPEQKLNLIELHQANGAIVAMTGDGVNDAPALKKADIGIAMGQRGTQVAQEAADMVLQDDAFSSIVAAIAQGRTIFRNIRQFTLYLLSGNMGEIIAVAAASVVNAPLPLLPLQILFLNAVNDVFPALALGVGAGNPAMMQHPPRKGNEAILTRRHWIEIVLYGALISVPVLLAFAIALRVWQLPKEEAVTLSFLTLAFARLWHVINMRSRGSTFLDNEVISNRYMWGAMLVCTCLLLASVYLPGLSDVLGTVGPRLRSWGLVIGTSFIPVVVGQLWQSIREDGQHI